MKCPNCGKEVEEGSKFCSACGARLEPSYRDDIKDNNQNVAHTIINNSSASDVLTPENFRSAPNYKGNLLRMVIFGGIAFIFSGLGLLGSLLFRFGGESAFGLAMMIVGMMLGVGFFVVTMTYNRKTFPNSQNVKMKGIEFLVPVFIAFTLACLVVALAVQGYYIVIH